ncbi:MAG: hypothetical protein H6711_03755 [Myxococcales bacterium]|nr:hypothetical protein [Myxococcales bacterium]
MRVAIASCRDLPGWEVDDRPLYAALRGRGVDLEIIPWDDPMVNWADFDACLIRTTWDYWDDGEGGDRRDEFVAWAERVAGQTRLFNPPEVIRWNTHKRYLRELEAAGAKLAPTIWLDAGATIDVAAAVAERGWSAGFIKPQIGACARETLRFQADPAGLAAAQAHLDRTLAREPMILQPYLRRVEREGETSLIFFDGAFSHAVQKIPVPGDYRVQDDHGASDRPAEVTAAEIDAAAALVEAAGGRHHPLLYARVDMMRDDEGAWVLAELEVVEPSLFFRHAPAAAGRLADALLARLRG